MILTTANLECNSITKCFSPMRMVHSQVIKELMSSLNGIIPCRGSISPSPVFSKRQGLGHSSKLQGKIEVYVS